MLPLPPPLPKTHIIESIMSQSWGTSIDGILLYIHGSQSSNAPIPKLTYLAVRLSLYSKVLVSQISQD